jgi:hypothetical protein
VHAGYQDRIISIDAVYSSDTICFKEQIKDIIIILKCFSAEVIILFSLSVHKPEFLSLPLSYARWFVE